MLEYTAIFIIPLSSYTTDVSLSEAPAHIKLERHQSRAIVHLTQTQTQRIETLCFTGTKQASVSSACHSSSFLHAYILCL